MSIIKPHSDPTTPWSQLTMRAVCDHQCQVKKENVKAPSSYPWWEHLAWAAPSSMREQTLWFQCGLCPGRSSLSTGFPDKRRLPCSHGWMNEWKPGNKSEKPENFHPLRNKQVSNPSVDECFAEQAENNDRGVNITLINTAYQNICYVNWRDHNREIE